MLKFNDGRHIHTVVERTACKRHKVSVGMPCWAVVPNTVQNSVAPAVCGPRILAAGYVGRISETSVQSKRKHEALKNKEVNA